jgi:hypothetical protein
MSTLVMALLREQITLLVLDWMTSKKITDSAAKMMWEIVALMMPEDANIASWAQIKIALKKAESNHVERIDICVNDCIAFWDSTSLPESYRHSHRQKCPECNELRYVTDPVDGKERSRKVFVVFHISTIVALDVDIFCQHTCWHVDNKCRHEIWHVDIKCRHMLTRIQRVSTHAGGFFLSLGAVREGTVRTR